MLHCLDINDLVYNFLESLFSLLIYFRPSLNCLSHLIIREMVLQIFCPCVSQVKIGSFNCICMPTELQSQHSLQSCGNQSVILFQSLINKIFAGERITFNLLNINATFTVQLQNLTRIKQAIQSSNNMQSNGIIQACCCDPLHCILGQLYLIGNFKEQPWCAAWSSNRG